MQKLIAELVASGPRVRDRGPGRVLPGRHAARLRRAVAPHARGAARERGRARRGRRAEAQPGRLRAVEGREAGRADVGVAVGRGPARLAHRVLGDVARDPRRRASTSTAAATTSCSRTTRTRSRRPRAPATSSRGTGCTSGMVNVGRREDVEVARQLHDAAATSLDRYDPRAFRLLVLQTHYRRQMEIGEKELADAEKAVERLDACRAPGAPRRVAGGGTGRGDIARVPRRDGRRLRHAGRASRSCSTSSRTPNTALDAGPPPTPRRVVAATVRSSRPRSGSSSHDDRRRPRRRDRRAGRGRGTTPGPEATSPRPTASATSCRRRASCSRTRPAAPSGGGSSPMKIG